jgi:hypothetical protein
LFGDVLDRGVLRTDRIGELGLQRVVLVAQLGDRVLVHLGADDLHLVHEVAEADGADVDHPEVLDARRAEVDEVGVPGAADAVPGQRVGPLDASERPGGQVLRVELVHAPSRAS